MQWLDRIGAKNGSVGIEIISGGLAIAAKGCLGKAEDIDVLGLLKPESEQDSLLHELAHFTHKHRIGRRPCHLVLHPQDYQLLLVEAPEVPDEALREAVRWRIKDLVTIPADKAVVDVFKLPADASKPAQKMLYAVVSELGRVQELIGLVKASGLTLASIDIGEMAMRNVSLLVSGAAQERGVGIARIVEGGGVVSLYRRGNLYLSRQFQLQYRAGLLDDLPVDTLALEVQRSLDYYERQMGLAPPTALYLCGENVSRDKITPELTRSINVPAKYLDIGASLSFAGDIDDGMTQVCMGALGGVYRGAFAA